MRDDTPCESLSEFYGITTFPDWSRSLLEQANTALEVRGGPVPGGVGASLAERYQGASFERNGRTWVACRTSLVSSNAQLLDATLALKAERNAQRAVAILDAPEASPNAQMPSAEYRTRYRRAAWHGLGVVFGTAEELTTGWFVDPVRPNNLSGWLSDLVCDVEAGLGGLGGEAIEALSDSAAAESVIKPVFDRLLLARGFESHSSTYQSYWRRPRADGVWTRAGAALPQRVHLEVKLTEDDEAPFCQVFEGIGIADAVVQVRLVKRSVRGKLDELIARYPWVPALKKQVEERLPIRFIEVG